MINIIIYTFSFTMYIINLPSRVKLCGVLLKNAVTIWTKRANEPFLAINGNLAYVCNYSNMWRVTHNAPTMLLWWRECAFSSTSKDHLTSASYSVVHRNILCFLLHNLQITKSHSEGGIMTKGERGCHWEPSALSSHMEEEKTLKLKPGKKESITH